MAIGNITFSGLSTGLPADLIDQLVAAESVRRGRLETKQERYTEQKEAFSTFEKDLVSVKSNLLMMQSSFNMDMRSASSTDDTKVTATVSSDALIASHEIKVNQLAAHDMHAMDDGKGLASTTTALTGQDNASFAFTTDGKTYTFALTKDVSSLSDLTDAINTSDAGEKVQASIMNDGSGSNPYRLVLTSRESGTANKITDIVATNVDLFSSGDFVNFKQASDAEIEVNGITVESATNTFNSVIKGVTLQVNKTTNSETITVGANPDGLKGQIEQFVKSYNKLVDFVNTHNNRDDPGVLKGDSTSRGVLSRMRNLIAEQTQKVSGDYGSLADLGIVSAMNSEAREGDEEAGIEEIQAGYLMIDNAKLNEALAADLDGVADVFTSDEKKGRTGLSERLNDYLGSVLKGGDGILASRTGGITNRIDLMGDRIDQENDRIDRVRERLTKKFAALERMVSTMQSQGDGLLSTLKALSGSKD